MSIETRDLHPEILAEFGASHGNESQGNYTKRPANTPRCYQQDFSAIPLISNRLVYLKLCLLTERLLADCYHLKSSEEIICSFLTGVQSIRGKM